MTQRFHDKYRVPSTRLQNWDYGWNGNYFITVCTAGHEPYFGKISDNMIELSEIGLFAQQFWIEIPNHFPFIELDAFVVMPSHIHGILVIDKKDDQEFNLDDINYMKGHKRFRNPGKNNISSIIGSYKSFVTKNAHKISKQFEWQTGFYDHIIKSDWEFDRIRQYIDDNPANWGKDKYFNDVFL